MPQEKKTKIVATLGPASSSKEIIEKMMVGRLKKFVAEISLSEQPFIKDPDIKIGALAKKAEAEIVSFTRFEVGEGIEKEVVDFAAEVAAAVKGG